MDIYNDFKGIGTDVMEEVLLNQYSNSTELKQYLLCFVEEADSLIEEVYKVYYGRLLEHADGKQLDIIADILGISRDVYLEVQEIWFGFRDTPNSDGFGSNSLGEGGTATNGGIFKSATGNTESTPLVPDEAGSEELFRRFLLARCKAMAHDVVGYDEAYDIIKTFLGREPAQLKIYSVGDVIYIDVEASDNDTRLIEYISPWFIPMGYGLVVNGLPELYSDLDVTYTINN